jgi:hypothetical protein
MKNGAPQSPEKVGLASAMMRSSAQTVQARHAACSSPSCFFFR